MITTVMVIHTMMKMHILIFLTLTQINGISLSIKASDLFNIHQHFHFQQKKKSAQTNTCENIVIKFIKRNILRFDH